MSTSTSQRPTAGASRTRRVLIVTNGLTFGGAETQTVHLACGLAQRGFDVRLLSILPTLAHAERLAEHGILVSHVPLAGRLPASVASIRHGVRVLRDWPPDVLISFVYQSNVLGRIAGALTRTPIIISSVRNENFGGGQRERLIRLTDRLATITTTNSQIVADALVHRGVVPPGRLRVIPNAVDTDRFRPPVQADQEAGRQALGLSADEFGWLGVGRLEPQKAWPVLLDAARSIPDHHRIAIVGDGPGRDELTRLIGDHGLTGRVTLMGKRADVDVLMRGADALVLSSGWEGLPNVVAEAMASGLPVVATDVGGVRELVSPEHSIFPGAPPQTGLIVAPQDPAALSKAMTAMAGMAAADRRAMGTAAVQAIAEGFARERVLDRWIDLIQELRDGHGDSRRPADGVAA